MSIQLLEALVDGTATAVFKRNSPTIILILLPMIMLSLIKSVSDSIYYNTLSLLPSQISSFFLSFLAE